MTTRKDDLGREAGPEKTAPIKYSNSACLVMEFDTYEEALAFAGSAAKLSSTTRTSRTSGTTTTTSTRFGSKRGAGLTPALAHHARPDELRIRAKAWYEARATDADPAGVGTRGGG